MKRIETAILRALKSTTATCFDRLRHATGVDSDVLIWWLCRLCLQGRVEAVKGGYRLGVTASAADARAALVDAVRTYLLASGWKRSIRRRRPPFVGREESWCHPKRRRQPTDTQTALTIQQTFDENPCALATLAPIEGRK